MKKAVAYVRVSTDEQKEGLSLDNQEARIKAYAESQGLEISETYRDEGFSAKDTKRPQMERLLEDVREGRVNLILVYRLDRLTRSMKDLYSLLELFKKQGVAFKSISEDFCTNTPVGKVVLGIIGLFAEWERDVISGRIKDALGHKKLKQEWVGRPPVGYKILQRTDGEKIVKDKHLTIDEDGARIVKMIFQARARGEGLTDICRMLAGREMTGRKWSPIGVSKILSNSVYIGNGKHDPIISRRLFDRVNGRMEI